MCGSYTVSLSWKLHCVLAAVQPGAQWQGGPAARCDPTRLSKQLDSVDFGLTRTKICLNICICICTRMCMYRYMHTYTLMCMYMYMYIVCICIGMYVCICICMYIYIHIQNVIRIYNYMYVLCIRITFWRKFIKFSQHDACGISPKALQILLCRSTRARVCVHLAV